MLRIVNVEEIQELLRLMPGLIDDLKKRESRSIENVGSWLEAMEQTLANNHLSLAGNVAGLRGVLDGALNGVIPVGIEFHGHATMRKIREAAAVEVLRRARDLVTIAIQDDTARIAEAERLGRQLIAVAKFKGLIPESPDSSRHTESLKAIWSSMQANSEIVQGAVHLLGLVGPQDALIVLDRGITRDVWNE